MTEQKLPAWPTKWPHMDDVNQVVYERARADAALARLRVAVEALEHARKHMADAAKYPAVAGAIHGRIYNALHAIGPIPEL